MRQGSNFWFSEAAQSPKRRRPLLQSSFALGFMIMPTPSLSIRLDFANGDRIGPGKIALLEAIRSKGSITVAAQHLGMSYRRARLLIQAINSTLQQPAVATSQGGRDRGGTVLTPVGEEVIKL